MAADDHKRYERARDLGAQAGRAGKPETSNPYRAGTMRTQYDAWVLGHAEGKADRRRRK